MLSPLESPEGQGNSEAEVEVNVPRLQREIRGGFWGLWGLSNSVPQLSLWISLKFAVSTSWFCFATAQWGWEHRSCLVTNHHNSLYLGNIVDSEQMGEPRPGRNDHDPTRHLPLGV